MEDRIGGFPMKKTFRPQWYLVFVTLFVSLVGVVVRWQQINSELLPDGGLAEGSFLHYILLAFIAILFVSLILSIRLLPKKNSWSQVFSPNFLANGLHLVSAAGLAMGNVILWINGRQSATFLATLSPEVSRALASVLPPLGILAAVCLAVFAVLSTLQKRPSPLLYMIVSLYLVLHLIVCFQDWNTDPSVHDYGFQLMAAICCMLGAFQLAGFSFEKGRLRLTLFWTLCATAFSCISIADTVLKGTVDSTLINLSLFLTMAVSSGQLLAASRRDEAPVDG